MRVALQGIQPLLLIDEDSSSSAGVALQATASRYIPFWTSPLELSLSLAGSLSPSYAPSAEADVVEVFVHALA